MKNRFFQGLTKTVSVLIALLAGALLGLLLTAVAIAVIWA
jgi:xanthine/uracil permease